ncbi:alpha/beta fold hydrolase [Sphingomonas sp.]|jgi:pimeloyl-ACP methyl ester carboxylesterase|uniref:alpha/beta fold hydrolase n=1 Tax=Sphingomonas sp. TaxID=28214 RepID=UPI0035686654
MPNFNLTNIPLPTGVTLDVATAGDPAHPPILLLHGFPESHRTWRHVIPQLSADHFVIAPDQRGFARSSKPANLSDYTPDKMVADLLALADHFGLTTFTLVGHDWGGAVAWMAALQNPKRITRLVIVNAPHPFVFQRTLFDDMAQRAASQYIRAFRNPDFEKHVASIGLSAFFDGSFAPHTDLAKMAEEKPIYLDQWGQPGALTAMLNWYRASPILVPAMDETPERPAFLDGPFPPIQQPTLVVWGLKDAALLPSQLEGLDTLVPDLTLVKVDAGHFVPWENPDAIVAAIREWEA